MTSQLGGHLPHHTFNKYIIKLIFTFLRAERVAIPKNIAQLILNANINFKSLKFGQIFENGTGNNCLDFATLLNNTISQMI